MRKLIAFILIVSYVVGTMAGVLSCIYLGAWPPAICVVLLAYMAYPRLQAERSIILDEDE